MKRRDQQRVSAKGIKETELRGMIVMTFGAIIILLLTGCYFLADFFITEISHGHWL